MNTLTPPQVFKVRHSQIFPSSFIPTQRGYKVYVSQPQSSHASLQQIMYLPVTESLLSRCPLLHGNDLVSQEIFHMKTVQPNDGWLPAKVTGGKQNHQLKFQIDRIWLAAAFMSQSNSFNSIANSEKFADKWPHKLPFLLITFVFLHEITG